MIAFSNKQKGGIAMRLLTIPEVAALLRVTIDRAYQLAREGLLPTVRLGRQIRVSEDALLHWLNNGGSALPR